MHANHMTYSLGFDWVSVALSLLFLGGTFFYLFRLLSPGYLRRVNGYYDGENEFWHGTCLLGMVGCLTPAWLPVSPLVWITAFAVGTGWYLFRALTYGRRLTYNKQWYDFAHAGMLFGMFWMFAQPVSHPFYLVFAGYWLWFGSYYVYRLILDFKKPSWLAFGQDGAHFVMSAVMLIMTLWPAAFSGHSQHYTTAPADEIHSVSGATRTQSATAVTVVGDLEFDAIVLDQKGTVVVLVSGGCVNCATEIPVFDGLATSLSKQAQFVRIHKDNAPNACRWLNTKECPAIIIVKDGSIIARLDGFADHEAMEKFLRQHVGVK